MAPTALITGISGQDGSYMAELLLGKGYDVHGLVRRSTSLDRSHIDHLKQPRLFLHDGDMTDSEGLKRLIEITRPDEVYNLATQRHAQIAFDQPENVGETDGLGAARLLEAIQTATIKPRFFQASTSEMFGTAPLPQNEATPFRPLNPYAIAKLYAHWMTVMYREAYGLFACTGILFNHESPRRHENFVTRKVTRGIAMILAGKVAKLQFGNLESRRDWGHARDYVEAMWLMLQEPNPDDYVIASGESRSVRDFIDTAFSLVGLDWRSYVEVDKTYLRPTDAPELRGDASKAARVLGWKPKTSFAELVHEMVVQDLLLEGIDPARHMRSEKTSHAGPAPDRLVRRRAGV